MTPSNVISESFQCYCQVPIFQYELVGRYVGSETFVKIISYCVEKKNVNNIYIFDS